MIKKINSLTSNPYSIKIFSNCGTCQDVSKNQILNDFYMFGVTNDELESIGDNNLNLTITNNYEDTNTLAYMTGSTKNKIAVKGIDTYTFVLKKSLKAINGYKDYLSRWLEVHKISDKQTFTNNSGWVAETKGYSYSIVTDDIKTNYTMVDYETYLSSETACSCYTNNKLYYYNPSGFDTISFIYVLDNPIIFYNKKIDILLHKDTKNEIIVGENIIRYSDGNLTNQTTCFEYYIDIENDTLTNIVGTDNDITTATPITSSKTLSFGKGKNLTSNKYLNVKNNITLTLKFGMRAITRFDGKSGFYLDDFFLETDERGYIGLNLIQGNYTIKGV